MVFTAKARQLFPVGAGWSVGASQHPARLASPRRKSTVRSARTHATTPRACVQIAPDRPSVAGTPADKRFDNAASDTSKNQLQGCPQNRVNSNSDRLTSVVRTRPRPGVWNDGHFLRSGSESPPEAVRSDWSSVGCPSVDPETLRATPMCRVRLTHSALAGLKETAKGMKP